jgi:hypothetical protein
MDEGYTFRSCTSEEWFVERDTESNWNMHKTKEWHDKNNPKGKTTIVTRLFSTLLYSLAEDGRISK